MITPSTCAHPAAAPAALPDRRATVRHACNLEGLSRPVEQPDAICWGATVRDLSCGGLGLVVGYPFRAGTFLAIDLRTTQGAPRTFLTRIVHVRDQADGTWLVGCEFARPLAPGQLDELL
ncbi:MAG: PilZ domain-containing protein [Gemmataceae bacterium]|nr:PilZ domain-containing protein [Gemmataceae bacterium]